MESRACIYVLDHYTTSVLQQDLVQSMCLFLTHVLKLKSFFQISVLCGMVNRLQGREG